MSERAYTVAEIDVMRAATRRVLASEEGGFWSYANSDGAEAVRDRRRISATVEDRLRTYMTAGIEPSELKKQADDLWARA